MNRVLSIFIVFVVAFFLLTNPVCASFTPVDCEYNSTYWSYPNYIINASDSCVVSAESMIIAGNVHINGNLSLSGTAFLINGSSNNEFLLNVNNTGKLWILSGSNLSNAPSGPNVDKYFDFFVENGALFELNSSNASYVSSLSINASNAVVHNTTIYEFPTHAVILQESANNANISSNTFKDNNAIGVYTYSDGSDINNNIILDNNNGGVYLNGASGNIVRSNDILCEGSSNKKGIFLTSISQNNTFSSNTIKTNCSNCDAIYLSSASDSWNNITHNNVSTYNGTDDDAINLYCADNNTIEWNNITSARIGIFLDNGADDNNISQNMITDTRSNGVGAYTGTAIFWSASSRNNVSHNQINDCKRYCLYMSGSCGTNTVEFNNVSNGSSGGVYFNVVSLPNTWYRNNFSKSDSTQVHLNPASNQNFTENTFEGDTGENTEALRIDGADSNHFLRNNFSLSYTGVHISDSHNNTFNYNNISDCSEHGMYLLVSSSDNNISNNSLSANPYCVRLGSNTDGNLFFDNNITACTSAGLYLKGTTGTSNHYYGNNISSCIKGIELSAADDQLIENNILDANTEGIVFTTTSNDNNISSNTIQHSLSHGISIVYSSGNINNLIFQNTIDNNSGSGVCVNFNKNTILNNTISTNGAAGVNISTNLTVIDNNHLLNNANKNLYLYTGSSGPPSLNVIANNTFSGSTFGIYDLDGTNNNYTYNQIAGVRGLWAHNTTNLLIYNNTVTASVYGLSINESLNSNNITGNDINTAQAIYVAYSKDQIIFKNYLHDSTSQGLFCNRCNTTQFTYNNVSNCGDGVHIQYVSVSNNISNNNISNSSLEGVDLVQGVMNTTIQYNTIDDIGQYGVIIDANSNGTIVTNNNISRVGRQAIRIETLSKDTTFTNNRILDNNHGVYIETNCNMTTFTNDYIANSNNASYGYGMLVNASGGVTLQNVSLLNFTNWSLYAYDISSNHLTIANSEVLNSMYGFQTNNATIVAHNTTLNGSTFNVYSLGNGGVNATNVTTNMSMVNLTNESIYYRKWYVSVYVYDVTTGNPISGAFVSATSQNTSNVEWNVSTLSTGRYNYSELVESSYSATDNISISPHNFTATISGYNPGSVVQTITDNSVNTISISMLASGSTGGSAGGSSSDLITTISDAIASITDDEEELSMPLLVAIAIITYLLLKRKKPGYSS